MFTAEMDSGRPPKMTVMLSMLATPFQTEAFWKGVPGIVETRRVLVKILTSGRFETVGCMSRNTPGKMFVLLMQLVGCRDLCRMVAVDVVASAPILDNVCCLCLAPLGRNASHWTATCWAT